MASWRAVVPETGPDPASVPRLTAVTASAEVAPPRVDHHRGIAAEQAAGQQPGRQRERGKQDNQDHYHVQRGAAADHRADALARPRCAPPPAG